MSVGVVFQGGQAAAHGRTGFVRVGIYFDSSAAASEFGQTGVADYASASGRMIECWEFGILFGEAKNVAVADAERAEWSSGRGVCCKVNCLVEASIQWISMYMYMYGFHFFVDDLAHVVDLEWIFSISKFVQSLFSYMYREV